ncbi:hypothetical protein N783_00240 [Pontibacillus marinus BH030004 = DSM 16465]|uniref:Alcohol dehydrogenase n=1 Tax=Pontibacillus marinus BH030004 = DSM 16465 TaxID=1385511 RepID=A0A0A5GL25_9BACI|nr:hypothetical protein N783_00240 [Pontibacillus marinus BH030004 = DSM 16465]
MPKLYEMIENQEFDPTDIITHKLPPEEAAKGYDFCDKKEDEKIKVVLKS